MPSLQPEPSSQQRMPQLEPAKQPVQTSTIPDFFAHYKSAPLHPVPPLSSVRFTPQAQSTLSFAPSSANVMLPSAMAADAGLSKTLQVPSFFGDKKKKLEESQSGGSLLDRL